MLSAKDIMTKEPITLNPDMEVSKAAAILLEHSINGAPVVDSQGRLAGILCQSDLVAQQKKLPMPSYFTILDGYIPLRSMEALEKEITKIAGTTVAEVMTLKVVSVKPDASLEQIAALMVDKKFHTLPVVDGGKLVGVIGKEDVLRANLAQ